MPRPGRRCLSSIALSFKGVEARYDRRSAIASCVPAGKSNIFGCGRLTGDMERMTRQYATVKDNSGKSGRRKTRPLEKLAPSGNKKPAGQDMLVYEEEDTEDWSSFLEEYDALEAEDGMRVAPDASASQVSEDAKIVEEYRLEEDADGNLQVMPTKREGLKSKIKSAHNLLQKARQAGAMTEDDWFEFLRRTGMDRSEENDFQSAFFEDVGEGEPSIKHPPPLRKGRHMRKAPPKFVDRIGVAVTGGKGGKGCISFEKMANARGGAVKRPSGGHGGQGGDVIFVADPRVQSLGMDRHHFHGKAGGSGDSNKKHGARGAHAVVRVPCGTVVKEVLRSGRGGGYERVQVCDLDQPLSYYRAATGGRPGLGNSVQAGRARNSASASGNFRSPGHQGEERFYELELKTIADVGLVGYPNAGKSTLLGGLSRARPAAAAYPFTTLHPTVGRVEYTDAASVTVADLPGLIEGAHANKGLGHEFLRHIERTKVLVYVLDGVGREGGAGVDDGSVVEEAPVTVFRKLKKELELYCPGLSRRPSLVWLNKADLNAEWVSEAKAAVMADVSGDDATVDRPQAWGESTMGQRGRVPNVLSGSARTGEGIGELAHELRRVVDRVAQEDEKAQGYGGGGGHGGGEGGKLWARETGGSDHALPHRQGGIEGVGGRNTTKSEGSIVTADVDSAADDKTISLAEAYAKALELTQRFNVEWMNAVQCANQNIHRAQCYSAALTVTYRQDYWLAHGMRMMKAEEQTRSES